MESKPVCRTCLSKRANKNISELESQNNHANIMLFCLDIEVQKNPKVSTKLCLRCYKKITTFYEFKVLALKNDAFLISQMAVKEEYTSDNDSSNGAQGFNECHESLVEDKIYIQKCINIEESKDVLAYDCNIKIPPLVDDVKLELVKYEDNSDGKSNDEAVSVNNKDVNIEIKDNLAVTKENEQVKIKKIGKKDGSVPKEKSQVCEECGKTVRNLKDHSNLHLPPGIRKKYACKSCDKVFSSYSARYNHIKNKHLLIKQSCPICNKQVINVKHHRLTMHEPAGLPVPCSLCDRRFISQSALDAHTLQHTKDRPYQCDSCDKKFRVKLQLKLHKRAVHDKEKTHMCQYCSKSFFKKYHLKMHIRTHTNEKPLECPDCGKCFATPNVLKNHRLIHSGVRAFACSFCDMTFIRSAYLRAHMVSHTKEKRYPCSYCGFRFGRSDHRKRHEKTHINKQRFKVKLPNV